MITPGDVILFEEHDNDSWYDRSHFEGLVLSSVKIDENSCEIIFMRVGDMSLGHFFPHNQSWVYVCPGEN
jgi:hypothetical protein